jgi:hypothetical protein
LVLAVLDNLVVQVPLKETTQTLLYILLCTLVPKTGIRASVLLWN